MANTNYTFRSVFALEHALTGKASDIAVATHILLALLVEQGRANKGFVRIPSLKGTKAVLPVITRVGNAEGVTVAGSYTPMSVGQHPDNDPTLVEFEFAHYRSNFAMDGYERDFLMKHPRHPNLDIAEVKAHELLSGFATKMSDHITGNATAAQNALLGLYYVLPDDPSVSSNNVGNFGAYSANANWRPTTRNVGAAFDKIHLNQGLMDSRKDTLKKLGGKQQADIILLPETTSARIYSAFTDQMGDLQRLPVKQSLMDVGWENIVYFGAIVHPYKEAPTGETDAILFLNSSNWFWGGDTMPQPEEPSRVTGTDVFEHFYTWDAVLAINDPTRQVKYYGVTAS